MTAHLPTPLDDEQPQPSNNYLSFLPANETELVWLLARHKQLSEQMGGLLPESLDLWEVHRVLDVACGVGGWAIDLAHQHPAMQVIGIDRSSYFIERARNLVQLEQVSNASFLLRDIDRLEGEEFTPESFDLIHLRFVAGDIAPQQFPPLVQRVVRLCKPGGSIVWTECEWPVINSLTGEQLKEMVQRALRVAGRAFSPGTSLGITALMGRWLLQCLPHTLEVSAGTALHATFSRQGWVLGHQVRPFLHSHLLFSCLDGQRPPRCRSAVGPGSRSSDRPPTPARRAGSCPQTIQCS